MSPSAQSIAAQAKHRKQAMAGSGESWILPRKWRDIQAGEGDVTLNGETLPVCKRVMLFKFSSSHGFSSEMLHYLRAAVIAQKLGYTLLGDDSEWNYGERDLYPLLGRHTHGVFAQARSATTSSRAPSTVDHPPTGSRPTLRRKSALVDGKAKTESG